MTGPENHQNAPVPANLLEIFAVCLVAGVIVGIGWRLVGEGAFARQAVVWVANVAMLLTIWIGLRIRGQSWDHLGLAFRLPSRKVVVRAVLQSIVVLVFALAAFVAGSILTMNLQATTEGADMTGYDYLEGNLPMLIVALLAVYVVSSFGEEVVYRGFLMTRVAEMGGCGKLGWGIAVTVSAIVFGLAHFDWGVVGIVQTTFMGLALALSFLAVKRKLWILVLAHVYIDTVLLVQMYIGMS